MGASYGKMSASFSKANGGNRAARLPENMGGVLLYTLLCAILPKIYCEIKKREINLCI
jgi:hypothetical protein